MSSHTSHMTDSEFIVFLPKLRVPTNFHKGSQELRFIRIFWSCWRQAGWHGVLLVYSISFPLFDVVCCCTLWCNVMWCNVITDIVLCLKIIHLCIIYCSAAIVRFWCCSAIFCSVLSIFFSLYFLSFSLSFCLFLFLKILTIRFFGNEKSRTLHLVSEHMVKRQPWLCWVLLIRDRVSSTLEWVWAY